MRTKPGPQIQRANPSCLQFKGKVSELPQLVTGIHEFHRFLGKGIFKCSGVQYTIPCPRLLVEVFLGYELSAAIVNRYVTSNGIMVARSDDPKPRRPQWLDPSARCFELRCGNRTGALPLSAISNDNDFAIDIIDCPSYLVPPPSTITFDLFATAEAFEPHRRWLHKSSAVMFLQSGSPFPATVHLSLINWWETEATPKQLANYARHAAIRAGDIVELILNSISPEAESKQ